MKVSQGDTKLEDQLVEPSPVLIAFGDKQKIK
jgi:hypothetical protein